MASEEEILGDGGEPMDAEPEQAQPREGIETAAEEDDGGEDEDDKNKGLNMGQVRRQACISPCTQDACMHACVSCLRCNAQVRVWWEPTTDHGKSGFSGAWWPARVLSNSKGEIRVEYDNGDQETVPAKNVSPLEELPVAFGEEEIPLQVREGRTTWAAGPSTGPHRRSASRHPLFLPPPPSSSCLKPAAAHRVLRGLQQIGDGPLPLAGAGGAPRQGGPLHRERE